MKSEITLRSGNRIIVKETMFKDYSFVVYRLVGKARKKPRIEVVG